MARLHVVSCFGILTALGARGLSPRAAQAPTRSGRSPLDEDFIEGPVSRSALERSQAAHGVGHRSRRGAGAGTVDLVGLVEFPYSGSTWVKFLLAAAVGLPTCAIYREGSCFTEGFSAFCPCSREDLLRLSPSGWQSTTEGEGPSEPLEYVPGVKVHAWSPADGVMLRKSHAFQLLDLPSSNGSRSSPLERLLLGELAELDKLLWLVRHPLDVLASVKRYGLPASVDEINNHYVNARRVATEAFRPASTLAVAYERLCSETAATVARMVQFIGHHSTNASIVTGMLERWPELSCRRWGDPGTSARTLDTLGLEESAKFAAQLAPAIDVWASVMQL